MKNILLLAMLLQTLCSLAQPSLQKLYPVKFSAVGIHDSFWKERMQKVSTATLDACILYTENKTGRIRNFEKAAAKSGSHEGIYYDDSDVYKALEAMAYSLKVHPNPVLEAKADEWIDKIAAAQMPDGYLNTFYQLTDISKRWTDMERHEDYCAGHLIEAAIAYYNTTGKSRLLDVAIRFADHIDQYFRLANRPWVSGHQEIELALMKLFHQTKNRNYLLLADWFLEQRGRGYGVGKIWDDWKSPEYCQDQLPVKDQREITGHAVRAMYMYTGAADVAAVNGDTAYIRAMQSIWEDVVYRNMYITGGIGAQSSNEGFGKDYDLPNENAYCETCASVGMVFWNQRMNMLSGHAKYIDVLERSLYNGALSGLSLSGDRFFYGNPLASSGQHSRREWFGTACCPSNIARLITSVGDYIYSKYEDQLYVQLYIGNRSTIDLKSGDLTLRMNSGFPWNGKVTIDIEKSPSKSIALKLRKPGWLTTPVPGDLYRYKNSNKADIELLVNGKPVNAKEVDGYLVLERKWKKGDRINLNFPMEVRELLSHPEVKQNSSKLALQYGPLVYCVEGIDNDGSVTDFIMSPEPGYKVSNSDLLGGVNTIGFKALRLVPSADKRSIDQKETQLTAIPYFSWNNREAAEMQVWLPTAIGRLKLIE